MEINLCKLEKTRRDERSLENKLSGETRKVVISEVSRSDKNVK